MKNITMKTLNKVFVFFAILIILFNIVSIQPSSASYLELGCDTRVSYNTTRNTTVANAIKDYYVARGFNVDSNSFKCSVVGLSDARASQYTQVMATYKDGNVIRHSSVYTQLTLGMDDVLIDLDEGRLVISNLMVSDIDAWNQIYDSVSGIITGLSGLGILVCLLAFVINVLKLGASAGNPMEREKSLKGILWTGVATAGCGAAALIFGIAYNLL